MPCHLECSISLSEDEELGFFNAQLVMCNVDMNSIMLKTLPTALKSVASAHRLLISKTKQFRSVLGLALDTNSKYYVWLPISGPFGKKRCSNLSRF